MPKFAKTLHFLASFMPVHFIVIVRALEQQTYLFAVFFGVLGGIGIVANLWVVYRFYRRADGMFVEVKSYKKSEENILFYLLSIVPIFVSADFQTPYSSIIFATIYLSVVAVCFNSKYLFVNPFLYFSGIKFFDATIISKTRESEVVILSNLGRLSGSPRLWVAPLGSEGWYIAAAR